MDIVKFRGLLKKKVWLEIKLPGDSIKDVQLG